jgi:hypothetical protein
MFKQCGHCGYIWKTRRDFLVDHRLNIIGYQANFKELQAGLFYFNHSCNNTLALPAHQFTNLYDGPIFEKRLAGSDECPEYCLFQDELRSCSLECECAYVREIIQRIKSIKHAKEALRFAR